MLNWALDLLVAGLLLATIAYCALLHRRLVRLRAERDELARFVDALDAAVRRAESATAGLARTSEEAAGRLAAPVDGATRLADELRLLIERGERLADRLVATIEAVRAPTTAPARTQPEPDAAALRRALEVLR